MESSHTSLLLAVLLFCVPALLFAAHRLVYWLRRRRWPSYRKARGSGGASCFVALQRIIEPQTRQVIETKDAKQRRTLPGDRIGEPGRPRTEEEGTDSTVW